MSRVRVGVVGTGWWATEAHIPSVMEHPGARLAALADRDEDRLLRAASSFDVAACFSSVEGLVGSGLVDAVVIATPHGHHYEAARCALDAGLHVLVEKPMTLRAAEAWDLVDRADRNSAHLVVGYTHQFSRHAALARQLVSSGEIGDVTLVTGLYTSSVDWLLRGQVGDQGQPLPFTVAAPLPSTYADVSVAGGGQGQTQMTHAVGMMLWVTGERVAAVSAFMDGLGLPVDVVDAVAFRLGSGAVGTMTSTGAVRPGGRRELALRYYGTGGHVLHDVHAGELWAHTVDGRTFTAPPLAPEQRHPVGAPASCLVDLVAGKLAVDDNPAPGAAAARAVEFVEAAYRAAATEAVVTSDNRR